MANENELEIILSLQDKVSKEFDAVANKLKKGAKDVEKEFENTGKAADKTNKSVIDGFKQQTSSVTSFLRIFSRVGMIWGVTAGVIIKSMVDLEKEINDLDRLSIKLGISTEELSMKFYGFNIANEITRTGAYATGNALSWFGNLFRALKSGVGEVIGENAILIKQFGVLGTGGVLTKMLPQQMSRGEAIKAIEAENIMKRQASKEGQTIMLAEHDLYQQLTLSKVALARERFSEEVQLMQQYGIDTSELEYAAMTRRSQDEEMELMRLSAIKLGAQNRDEAAFNMTLDRELMAYKRVWGEDGQVVQAYIEAQKILADSKATQIFQKNISGIASALGTLEGALAAAGETNKSYAKAAAAISLALAVINTAQGVTKAYAEYPWPFSMVVAGIIAAAGAVQVSTIASQKFSEGTDSVPAMLTPGEIVFPRTMADAIRSGDISVSGRNGGAGRSISISIEVNNPQLRSYDDIDELTEQISQKLARESERIG